MGLIEDLSKKEELTPVEVSLAEFILNDVSQASHLSLQELAEKSFVSKPSVIRFYRKLGFRSYREFVMALQLEQLRYEDANEIEDSSVFRESRDLYEFAEKIGILAKQIADNCIKAIDRNSLEDLIIALGESKRIFIYTDSENIAPVAVFMKSMANLDIDMILINEEEEPQQLFSTVDENDAILIVSGGRSKESEELLNRIVLSKAIKILISTRNDPSMDYSFDYSFYTYPNGNDFVRNNNIVSQMSLLLGMNIIYGCLRKIRRDAREKEA